MNGFERLLRTLAVCGMKYGVHAWLAGALLTAASAGFAAREIAIVERRSLPSSELTLAADASHELTVQLVVFRGTRWRTKVIAAAMKEVGPLLASCGIALRRVELQILRAPRALHYYSTPVSRELLRTVEVTKPAIFFVEDTRNQPAFDAEAIGRSNAARRPELADTVWIAYGSRDLAHVIAHELVHVLSDSGAHSDEPGNLMQEETSTSNQRLDAAQCAKLRTTGEANGLLTPRARAAPSR